MYYLSEYYFILLLVKGKNIPIHLGKSGYRF